MPESIPLIIGAVIAASGAAEAGLSISNALNAPSPPKQSTTPAAAPPVNPQTVQAAVSQQVPTLQSQVGGALSPEYYLQQALLRTGYAGQPGAGGAGQQNINQSFGFNPASAIANLTGPNYTPAGINAGDGNAGGFLSQDLSDLMRKAFGG